MEKKHLVKVIIPIYQSSLSDMEMSGLLNNMKVLSNYQHVIVSPKGLDISQITAKLAKHEVLEVSDEWLGSKNGISGYNKMMLSKDFYELFSDSQYILICHLDAWIFRDELQEWCEKNYDCIAPTWIRRDIYDAPFIKPFTAIKKLFTTKSDGITKGDIYNKIGNGGLSLRKVDSFLKACDIYKERINEFTQNRHHLYNEDVFWAIIPQEFVYPSIDEAMSFGFDTNPKYCLKMKQGKLPFGCHSWTKPRFYKFWKAYINY